MGTLNRLTQLKIREGSFVPAGDNPLADIVFFKAREGDQLENDTMDVEAIKAVLDGLDSEARAGLLKSYGYTDDDDMEDEDEKEKAALKARIAELEEAAAAEADDGGDAVDKALADLPEDVAKSIARLREDHEAMAKALDAIHAEREAAEAIEKARDLDLGIEAEKLAPVLTSLKKALDADALAEVERVFKACSAIRKRGDIETPAGSDTPVRDGDGAGVTKSDAVAKLDKLARERAEADGTSYAKAYTAVCRENPDLYSQAR